jgi:hypothetical protein
MPQRLAQEMGPSFATVRYLGNEVDDVLTIPEQIEI